MPSLTAFVRYLQRKQYQYYVSSSLYMLTPTERFIFNSFIFLFTAMILIAACLYLPQHLNFLSDRAWFYYHGDEHTNPYNKAATSLVQSLTSTVGEKSTATIGRMREAVETVLAKGKVGEL